MDDSGDLRLHYINEEGRQVEEYFDMVVLSVGLQTPKHVKELAEIAGIKLTADNFAATSDFAPVSTSRAGYFYLWRLCRAQRYSAVGC